MTNRLSRYERLQLDPAETHAFESPIPCQVVSNGEFLPARQGLLQTRFEARLKGRADILAGKHGISRRAFLRTASGMASAFLAMNEVYGAVFQVSEAEAADPELGDEHARQLSDQFVVDVHTHFLRDDTRLQTFVDMRTDTGRRGYNPELTRHAQTFEDVKFPTYVKEMFLDSDTKIAVLSGAPSDVPRDWMLSNDTIRHACDRVNKFAGPSACCRISSSCRDSLDGWRPSTEALRYSSLPVGRVIPSATILTRSSAATRGGWTIPR